MAEGKIGEILAQRRAQETAATPTEESSKFYSMLLGEGAKEEFLELRLSNGMCSAFNYSDLLWFNYDPEAGCIDLEIGGYLITITGRGLSPKLFRGIKTRRVDWIREADSEVEDSKNFETYIERISVTPPDAGSSDAA